MDRGKGVLEDERTDLVAWARDGDIRAFERLVKKYMRQVYFIALGFLQNHEDALN